MKLYYYYRLMLAINLLRTTRLERVVYDIGVSMFGSKQGSCSVYDKGLRVTIRNNNLTIYVTDDGMLYVYDDKTNTEKFIKVSNALGKALYYSNTVYGIEQDIINLLRHAKEVKELEKQRKNPKLQNEMISLINDIQVGNTLDELTVDGIESEQSQEKENV